MTLLEKALSVKIQTPTPRNESGLMDHIDIALALVERRISNEAYAAVMGCAKANSYQAAYTAIAKGIRRGLLKVEGVGDAWQKREAQS